MLPGELIGFPEYFRGVVSFLKEYSWLFKTPVTNILISDVLAMIPHDWIEPLLNLSNEELNNVPMGLSKVSFQILTCKLLVYLIMTHI
jgi:hypothetical protein